MSIKKAVFFILLFSVQWHSQAQNQIDFRGMPQSLVDFRINQHSSLTFIGNSLFMNDFHQLGFIFIDFGYKYRLTKSFGINVNYRALSRRQLNDNYLTRNLNYFDLDYGKSMNRLSLGATFRVQNEWIPNKRPIIYNRSKINLKYRLSYYWQPFTEIEVFTPLLHPTRDQPDQFRLAFGINYNFNEKCKLETYYQIRKLTNRIANNTYHVFSINFSYKL
jgi:hypothetical protein